MHTDRQTDRQTDIHTYRQTDRQTYMHAYIHTYMHANRYLCNVGDLQRELCTTKKGLFGGTRVWFPRAPIRSGCPWPPFWEEMNGVWTQKCPDKKSIIPGRLWSIMHQSRPSRDRKQCYPLACLLGVFVRHKWMGKTLGKTLPEGQFMFS